MRLEYIDTHTNEVVYAEETKAIRPHLNEKVSFGEGDWIVMRIIHYRHLNVIAIYLENLEDQS